MELYSKKNIRNSIIIFTLMIASLILSFLLIFFHHLNPRFFLKLLIATNILLCILVTSMIVNHISFFKELRKNATVINTFRMNEKFLLSFIKRINEIYASITLSPELGEISSIVSDLGEILKKLHLDTQTEDEVIEKSLLRFEEIDESLNMYFFQSITLIETLIKKTNEMTYNILNENMNILNNIICPTYISLEISKEWKTRIERMFEQNLNETFKKITYIKEINESNSKLIKDTIDNFLEQQKNSFLFLVKQEHDLNDLFSHMENIENNIINYINDYYKELETIDRTIRNIEEISESIKMVSLNMNIEASKTQGNKAFNILARELQSLSDKTEKFARQIEKEIKGATQRIRKEREKQTEDLSKLHELVGISRSLTEEYNESIQRINKSLDDLIKKINDNNERNKKLIFELFKSFQEVAITRDELNHKDIFITQKMEEINDMLLKILQEKQLCKEETKNYNERKRILESLSSIITTKREKEFLRELSIQYLNEELKEKDEEVPIPKPDKEDSSVIIF